MSNFRVGQKVVCVDSEPGEPRRNPEQWPLRGSVYTIRSFNPQSGGVRLVEIVNPAYLYKGGWMELSFFPRRFRPVKTTNIDVFRQMLNPVREDA